MLPNKLKITAPKAVFSRICSYIYTACYYCYTPLQPNF